MNQNKSKYKIFSLIYWTIVLLPIIILFSIILLISSNKIGYIPDFEELENPKSNLASEIISSDNILLGKYYRENRTIVKFKDLSPNLINALLATEDIRFYKHSGIDARGLARVLVKTIFLRQRTGGGSTISQQLAKNLYRMRAQTESAPKSKIGRIWGTGIMKFQEWVTAILLERNYTKEEILVMYMNTVTFGHNSFGIKSAAFTFFNTTPDSLTIEQSAVLVGLLKAPTWYSPLRNPERSKERRNTVINQIQKYQKNLNKTTNYKILTNAQYDSLRALPLVTDEQKQTHNEGLATYFREYLRLYLTAKKPEFDNYADWQKEQFIKDSTKWYSDPLYGWCNKNLKSDGKPYDIYSDGLIIHTTINSRMQLYAEQSMKEHLGIGTDKVKKKPLQEIFFDHIKNRKHTPYHRKLSEKQVNQILYTTMKRTERYRIHREAGLDSAEIHKKFHKPVKMKVFSWQGDIDTVLTPYDSIIYYKKFLRSGFISIEPATGYIRAYVGGIDYNHFKYDHVMVAKRQVGSTFKPFVYTVLMDNGYSPCYKVPNVPVTFEIPHGYNKMKAWTPTFSRSKFDGQKITLKLGLALSLNQISAWVMKQINAESVIEIIKEMGITTHFDPVPSLCVGAGEVILVDMVGAYCTYANKGVHVDPIFVTEIEDKYGNTLARFRPRQKQALDENTAFRVLELMRGVIQFGTSTRIWRTYKLKNQIAGKTGTTNDNSDGWFIGITPNLVSGAWCGGEERGIRFSSTGLGQGATMALPIWALYMQKVYADPTLPYSTKDKFERPTKDDGIETDCGDYNQNDNNHDNYIIIDDNY